MPTPEYYEHCKSGMIDDPWVDGRSADFCSVQTQEIDAQKCMQKCLRSVYESVDCPQIPHESTGFTGQMSHAH